MPTPADPYDPGSLTKLVADFLAEELGEVAAKEAFARAGDERAMDVLRSGSSISSYDQIRRLLTTASSELGDPGRLAAAANAVGAQAAHADAAQLMGAMGSPHVALAALVETGAMREIFRMEGEQVGPEAWEFRTWAPDGRPAYRELCVLMGGTLASVPALFGGPPGEMIEQQCQCDGAEHCRWSLRWESVDHDKQRAAYFENRAAALEGQLQQFRSMIGDLVSDEDPSELLRRVAESVAHAVNTSRALLVLATPRPGTSAINAFGFDEDDAVRIAALVLADVPVAGVFAVDIKSSRGHYGKLAVAGSAADLHARSPEAVESYATLAAAVLDSASTLSESRRQAATAEALLDLSISLAEISGVDEMAARVARAVPLLVDCDRCAVFLSDGEAEADTPGRLRLAAGHGYPDDVQATFNPEVLADIDQALDGEKDLVRVFETSAGSAAAVAAPIAANGEVIGWVVASVTADGARLTENAELPDRLKSLAAQASTAISNARLVDEIRHQSMHDSLTGLPNRALIDDRLEQMVSRTRRTRLPVAALFVDLDNFKEVNDTLGHDAGDQLLRAVADRLAATIRESDTVGRLGGDEFVVLVDAATADAGPELVAERLLDVMREPFTVPAAPQSRIQVTTSIGVATSTSSAASNLLRDADIALYEAKALGKNAFVIFHPEMQTALHDQRLLEMDLRDALQADQFFLMYQPIFDLDTAVTTGFEALVRWQHPIRGVVPPNEFIGLLEESGMIVDVGRWVLNEACRQGVAWRTAGHDLDISVNVSCRQLETTSFVSDIEHALTESGLDARSLILEITETALMRKIDAVIPRLNAIKALGVRIAIDDFGTGYSSLSYLRQLPIDTIKIDQSFIATVADSPEGGALLHTLVQLGKSLGLRTVAEGIEDSLQYACLQDEACDKGQGFVYARPLPAAEVVGFLANKGQYAAHLLSEAVPTAV